MTAAPVSSRHLDALTGIRGIAAWLVVLYHIRMSLADLLPAGAIAALSKGYLAVDLFFMLSGFVLWYNYADRLQRGGMAAAKDFLWRRLARIWPLHGLVLLGFAALAAVLAARGDDTSAYPVAELPLHVLLAQNWGTTGALSWNHPAWSISTEMAAYLLFPLAVAAVRWDRLGSAALIAIATALLITLHTIYAVHGFGDLGEDIPRLGIWRCLIEFALGTIMCMLWMGWHAHRRAALLAAAACAVSLALGWLLALPEIAFAPFAFAAGLLALALDRSAVARFLGSGAALYLGEISYSTYLAHFGLFIAFKLAFVDASLQIGWGGLAGFLVLVLGVSIALYRFVEKPAQRWLNARMPSRAPAPDAVTAG